MYNIKPSSVQITFVKLVNTLVVSCHCISLKMQILPYLNHGTYIVLGLLILIMQILIFAEFSTLESL